VKTWDETDPADTKLASLGAGDIRELTYAVRERMAVDHRALAIEGADANIGRHDKVTLIDQVADLLGSSGAVRLYGKTISGKVELFLVMADNTVIQLTSGGKLNAAAIAGVIPIANLATGTPDGTKFIRDDGTLGVALQTVPVGSVVQVVNYQTGSEADGTGTIPEDNTIPQNTEGVQFLTLAITPKSATDVLKIEVALNLQTSSANNAPVALFKDDVANAIASFFTPFTGSTQRSVYFSFFMVAGTTSEITFKVRAGGISAGTTTMNANGPSTPLYGGSLVSGITITEIKE
jgi:hypothetical protein